MSITLFVRLLTTNSACSMINISSRALSTPIHPQKVDLPDSQGIY